jgi:streptogramin lyase
MAEITQRLRVSRGVPRAKRLGAIATLLGVLVAFGVGIAGAAPLGTNNLYGTSFGLLPGAMLGQGKAGADGNFWFLDNNKGASPFGNKAIGQISPITHVINEYLLPNGIPRFLGAGPDGNLWVSVVNTSAVGVPAIDQVVPNGTAPPTINVFSTRTGSRPNQLGKGPDGNLWFTDSGSPKAVGLICLTSSPLCTTADVTSHASHEFSGGSPPCSSSVAVCSGSLYAGSTPRFVAAGPNGNVWFTDNGSTPAIGEVNATSGAITERSVALNGGSAGRSPGTIVAGPDGNLWFADAVAGSPAIGEFNLTTDTITEYGHSDGLQTGSLVNGTMEGPDGNMWFTDSSTTVGDAPIEMICLTVSQVCTNADVVAHAIHEFPVLTYPTSIGNSGGIGSDGNLWWVDQTATPAIGQFSLGVCDGNSLRGCNMQGVNRQNISLDGANLQGSNLHNAQLENASLVGANMRGDNLQGAQLQSYAQLSYASLQGANLQHANVAGAYLIGANLRGSNLQGADLAGANFTNADLAGANLHGANLTGANLTGANLKGANLHGATVTGAVWSNTTCPDGSNSDDDGGTCVNNE